jgi:hypothetical protein
VFRQTIRARVASCLLFRRISSSPNSLARRAACAAD